MNRLRRSLRRHLQVAAAAWRGFNYRRSIGAPVVSEGLALVRRVLMIRRRAKVPFAKWKFRLKQCRGCGLYDPVRRACGDNTGILQVGKMLYPNGCSCLVGVKASDEEAQCTMVSFKLPSNWASLVVSLDGTTEAKQGAPGNHHHEIPTASNQVGGADVGHPEPPH